MSVTVKELKKNYNLNEEQMKKIRDAMDVAQRAIEADVAGRRSHFEERVPHTNCEIYEKKPDHGGAYAGGAVHSADQRIRKKHELSEEITGVRAFLMQK